jgi:hypothetical protein
MAKKKVKQVQKPIVKNIELEIIEKYKNYYKKRK